MTSSHQNMECLKNSIVTELFVDTFDQNYIIARWAYHRGLFTDFLWNSVHSLEKYFKASLLLNGHSGKNSIDGRAYGHNLVKLFDDVSSYASDLLPEYLERPKQLGKINWNKETLKDYIARLNELGSANNRYNLYGYVIRWEDLCHLDQAVFLIRRLAFDLNAYPFLGRPGSSGSEPKTVREMLTRFPKHCLRGNGSRLHQLLSDRGDDKLRDAGLTMNFVFAPDDYDHNLDKIELKTSSSNSVLYRRIVEITKNAKSSPTNNESANLANWIVDNISLPKSDKNELKECAKNLKN